MARDPSKHGQPQSAVWTRRPLIVAGGILGVVVLAGLILAWRLSTQAVEILDLSGTVEMGLTASGRPYRGSLDAPVVVIAYEDPRCTQCQDFFAHTEPYVLDEYIKTGLVREEAFLLPILGAESLPASEAAECAAEQGKFWEYRQLLFLNLPSIEQTAGRAELLTYARVAGVNLTAFTTCIDGGRHRTKLLRLATEAVGDGIEGVPTFVIDGRPVPGARPFVGDENGPGFQDFVEQALAAKGFR